MHRSQLEWRNHAIATCLKARYVTNKLFTHCRSYLRAEKICNQQLANSASRAATASQKRSALTVSLNNAFPHGCSKYVICSELNLDVQTESQPRPRHETYAKLWDHELSTSGNELTLEQCSTLKSAAQFLKQPGKVKKVASRSEKV